MAKRTKTRRTVGRFGARYGRYPRQRTAVMEKLAKSRYTCPNCSASNVTRTSAGVWKCSRCDVKFAGGAYTPTIPEEARKKVVSVEEYEEEVLPEEALEGKEESKGAEEEE